MAAFPTASSSSTPIAAAAAAEATDGPMLRVVSKRLRALRKKHNRILQMEESVATGKTLNREKKEVLRSKPVVATLIDELERLRSSSRVIRVRGLRGGAPVRSRRARRLRRAPHRAGADPDNAPHPEELAPGFPQAGAAVGTSISRYATSVAVAEYEDSGAQTPEMEEN